MQHATNEATSPKDTEAILSEARIEAARKNVEAAGAALERAEVNLDIARRRLGAATREVMEAREKSPGPFASSELKAALFERTQAVNAVRESEAAVSFAQIRRMDARLALQRAEKGLPDPAPAVVIGGPGVLKGKPEDWEKPGHEPAKVGRFVYVEQSAEPERMVNVAGLKLTESEARRRGLL